MRIRNVELPDDLKFLIQAELFVAPNYRDLCAQSLSDDLAVEGIRVMKRQIKQAKRMPDRVGQRLKVQVLNRLMDFGERKSEFGQL
jgi:hypothetical protein